MWTFESTASNSEWVSEGERERERADQIKVEGEYWMGVMVAVQMNEWT
jgi:hypothetical protein